MAYSDYGAYVWLNGQRRKDKEDVATFATDEETFGESSENIGSGARIFCFLLHKHDENVEWVNHIHHGILGDGDIRVMCHKQGLPYIYEATEEGINEVKYYDREKTDIFEYGEINFEYKGYKFSFVSGEPYYAQMITPNGDNWECKYDYLYGAGF